MATEFGKFCRKLRIDNDEHMVNMAEKLGVTSSYLSAVENGKRKVPEEWFNEISKHYTLTSSQIIELGNLILIDKLSIKEKTALKAAIDAIYFNDNSDYLSALWSVVSVILGHDVVNNEGFSDKSWFDLLKNKNL